MIPERCFPALALALVAQLSLPAIFSARAQQLTINERRAEAGDAPADPGPLANLSPTIRPADVKLAMRKVADWQMARVKDTPSQDWTFATLYLGMLATSDTLEDARYRDMVAEVANHYQWTLGPRKAHADDQAIGQSYLWLYNLQHDPQRIASMRNQFDNLMQQPDPTDPKRPVWWWCDALFMTPPVWTQLATVTGDSRYLDYMDHEWHITANLLWSQQDHLFYRDASYFDKYEKNGRHIYWSRGNGWVMGGLVRVLTFLPKNDPRRAFYLQKFREMAASVRALQGEEGLWRAGLADAQDYANPEVSGSAFFVYAMAWGIREHVLSRATYLPVVRHGWAGLVSHIYQDGRLGCIQPVGQEPGAYTPSSSYVFGSGAFLLAGSEVAALKQQ